MERQRGREGGRESLALRGWDRGSAFGRRKLPAMLLSELQQLPDNPSFLTRWSPLSSLLPPLAALLGVGRAQEGDGQASRSGPGRWRCQGPLPPTYPCPQEPLLGAVPQGSCSHTLAPPEARTHMLTPLTSFPRCTLLFHGFGEKGRNGAGTGREEPAAEEEIMGWRGGGGRGAELVRKLEGASWPLPLVAFCTSHSGGLGLSAVCRRRAPRPSSG